MAEKGRTPPGRQIRLKALPVGHEWLWNPMWVGMSQDVRSWMVCRGEPSTWVAKRKVGA